MIDQRITSKRLKNLCALDQLITLNEARLDHEYLLSEDSLKTWATQARQFLPPAEIEKALQTAANTRKTIMDQIARDKQERDSLLTWIASISKEDVRNSLILHYVNGYSYNVIADRYFGGTIQGEAVRTMCGRCIRGEHQGIQGKPQKKKDEG